MKLTKREFLALGAGTLAASHLFAQQRSEPPRAYPKLGILMKYTEANLKTASELGCQSVELDAHAGSTLDAAKLSGRDGAAIVKRFAAAGITVSAFMVSVNHIGPNDAAAARTQEYFHKLIDFTADSGVKVIGTHTGLIRGMKVPAMIEAMKRPFNAYLEQCEKRGVYLAFEGYPGENFATTPENFGLIFAAFPSKYLGLEYDPSHMVRQFIDPIPPARQWKDRIYHVHAKDTEIVKPVLQARGIMGDGWWRYRLPGFGEVNWAELVTVLLEANYAGGIDVEHEDNLFGWPPARGQNDIDEPQKEGYRVALRHLEQFLPGKSGV